MYEELIMNLRSVKDTWQTQEEEWMLQAADAIEKLIALTVDDIPTASHEMSAREYERAIDRAFYSADDAWGEWADAIDEGNKDEAVTIIEKWAREHPERSEECQE